MKSPALLSLNSEQLDTEGKGWVHLLPAGRFYGVDGRGPYDATDLEGIVLRSRDQAGLRKMPIDYNHSQDVAAPKGLPSPAAGWIVGLQARADGVWGMVEWTQPAAVHIANREYRYISPVLAHNQAGKVSHILRASLVNQPNLENLKSLFSEDHVMDEAEFEQQVRQLLGLEANADKRQIVDALSSRLVSLNAENGAVPDPTKYVPIGEFQRAVAEVNKFRQGITQHAAEERVSEEIRRGTILPWMRDWATSLCVVSLQSFNEFVGKVGPGFTHLQKSLLTGQPPTGAATNNGEFDDIARNLGHTPAEFAAYRKSLKEE